MSNKTHYLQKSSARKTQQSFFGLNISFHLETFIQDIQQNALVNDKGYVRLYITERKEVSQYGDTHSVVINDPYSTDNQLRNAMGDLTDEQKEKLLKQAMKLGEANLAATQQG